MAAVLVKLLNSEATLPIRGSTQAAGFDLSAAQATSIPAGGKAIVKTGLAVAVPAGTYARIAPRSGLAAKRMIDVGAGVVDSDYRGEVGVVLFNHGTEDFPVAVGDRIAQMIVECVDMAACSEVELLDDTARGAGGFGSTGVSEEPANKAARVESGDEPRGAQATPALMLVKKLRPDAVLPVRGSEQAAGFDLAAVEACTVPAGGKAIVKIGLSIAVPVNTYARIAPRSGLAAKRMIHCGAGVVDYDYRGEVGVVLFNYGAEDFAVAPGDRVAQLILEKISMASCQEVESLEETARGAGGFGSTGVSEKADASKEAEAKAAPSSSTLLVKRLVPEATMPVRGSDHAAGFDLAAAVAAVVPARGKAIVKTGLSIATPSDVYARIAPRSGLAAKRMLHCGAGVVDADYRGEVGVVLFNHGTEDFEVAPGDRVAQLILERVEMIPCTEVESLDDTSRGAGGFGSTGVASGKAEEKHVEGVADAQKAGAVALNGGGA
eukprot:TRINITY_DN1878_c0_g2_i1.p1 TRINITY_DN1878_c0_g2~~TRINITY_DN1878_c0_g2_i1.p1  ORF type:complete len:493 (-),score=133.23 TRINITY_DN1878_c0_g2_i1:178-1656(-)